MSKRVIVVGGGPAGMMAAATAGLRGHQVILLEKNEKLGKKLYITGKGRCNLTNLSGVEDYLEHIPRNPRFMYSALSRLGSQELVDLLGGFGLKVVLERGNRVFTESGRASDVTKALGSYMEKGHVDIRLSSAVRRIKSLDGGGFILTLSGKFEMQCDTLILATGGASYPLTGSTGDGYAFAREMGHKVFPPKASLIPMETMETWPHDLQGLSLKNIELIARKASKVIFQDRGEMLFTHFGISGPLVLTASSLIDAGILDQIAFSIDLKPALSEQVLGQRIIREISGAPNSTVKTLLTALMPQSLALVVARLSDLEADKPCRDISKEKRGELVSLIKNIPFRIKAYRPLDEAVITRGGVSTQEVDPQTMQSRIVKGLYFAGEMLDVDAMTGGYNLQIAFSTGYSAGASC
jgi:predicted Rossmann fold flavoprotein